MPLIQMIRCWLGHHRRSRYHAHMRADRNWHSVCSGCGAPMRWIATTNTWVAFVETRPRDRQIAA